MDGESENSNKKAVILSIAAFIVVAGVLVWYWQTQKTSALLPTTAVGTTKQASERVPKIVTNPADEVPEVNPLDRANPFKYTNPLR